MTTEEWMKQNLTAYMNDREFKSKKEALANVISDCCAMTGAAEDEVRAAFEKEGYTETERDQEGTPVGFDDIKESGLGGKSPFEAGDDISTMGFSGLGAASGTVVAVKAVRISVLRTIIDSGGVISENVAIEMHSTMKPIAWVMQLEEGVMA